MKHTYAKPVANSTTNFFGTAVLRVSVDMSNEFTQTRYNYVRNEMAPASTFVHKQSHDAARIRILLDDELTSAKCLDSSETGLSMVDWLDITAVVPHPHDKLAFLGLLVHGEHTRIVRWSRTAGGVAETGLWTSPAGCTFPFGFGGQMKGFYCKFKGWVCEVTFPESDNATSWTIDRVTPSSKMVARLIIPAKDAVINAREDDFNYADGASEAETCILPSSASGRCDWLLLFRGKRSISALDMRDPPVRVEVASADHREHVDNLSHGDTLVVQSFDVTTVMSSAADPLSIIAKPGRLERQADTLPSEQTAENTTPGPAVVPPPDFA